MEKVTQKMVWSSGSIKRIHRSVELKMQEIVQMTLINEIHDGESVDGIQSDEEAVFRFIIEKFGLSEKANNGTVDIALTIGGAKLKCKLCHDTIGFKLVDVDAIDPNTGEKVLKSMQSDQWSFPLVTIIEKDNKSTYIRYCDHIFFGNSVRVNGLVGSDGSQWEPFLISEPQDMTSHQICRGRGGAAKGPGVVHFCYFCMCTSYEIALPNQVQCEMCKAAPKHIYFHHNICGAAEVQRRREELAALDLVHLVMTIVKYAGIQFLLNTGTIQRRAHGNTFTRTCICISFQLV
jgi:hypothetical protein